jgi:hypothetical protein
MKRLRILVALCLFLASTAGGAITRTQAVSANADNATFSSTSANDLILVFAYANNATVIPSLPAGYTSLNTGSGNLQGFRQGYKLSSGGDTNSGTWTSATNVVVLIYSGVDTTTPIGAENFVVGNSATVGYPLLTLQVTDGTSWVAGQGGAKAATAGMNGNTADLTNRTSVTVANGLDTGAGVSSFPNNQSLTVTGSGRWTGASAELRAAAGAAAPKTNFFIFLKP